MNLRVPSGWTRMGRFPFGIQAEYYKQLSKGGESRQKKALTYWCVKVFGKKILIKGLKQRKWTFAVEECVESV